MYIQSSHLLDLWSGWLIFSAELFENIAWRKRKQQSALHGSKEHLQDDHTV